MSTMSATDLANALVGSGINITSATYFGDAQAAGTFTGASPATGLPFSSGIVLSSGTVYNTVGPNNSSAKSAAIGTDGNALLSAIAGGSTFDAAVLQFSFTTEANVFSFRYAFGSEEYNEWVGQYNDVFGFFLSGPGYQNPLNLATLPNSTPISINNINLNSNPAYYLDNESGAYDIQLDGLVGSTIPLYATASITPNVEYTITIAVADAFDANLDTAVFLGADSFVAEAPPSVPEVQTWATFAGVALVGAEALRRRKAARA